MSTTERTDYPDGRWTETGETSVTVAGVTYSIEVEYRYDGRTTFAFRTTCPPQGLDPVIYEFEGRLPHGFGR